MKGIKTGSEEHKTEFLEKTERQIQENIWLLEIRKDRLIELFEQAKKEKQTIEHQLEQKLFPSAGAGRQAIKAKDKKLNDIYTELSEVVRQLGEQDIDRESLRRYREGGKNADNQAEKSS